MKKIMLTITLLLLTFVSFNVVLGDTLALESQFNNITIFIRFNDETTYEAPYNYSYYDDMLNATDQPSLKNYYLEASYGTLTIDSFIPTNNGEVIFYTDTYDREYFEPYSASNPNGVEESGQADREHGLIQRALDYVDANDLVPNELDLDVNNDGEIDSLTFMISGEDSGWSSLLWPHKWELYTFVDGYGNFQSGAPTINGVNAYIYTWELLGDSVFYDYQVDVGVLCHETFHLLSAPDLYHYYDYFNITPVGSWGLMDNTGRTPSHMLGYMKEQYAGWIPDVTEISESGTYTLYPLQDSPENIYKIYTGVGNQWIYLEYRDDVGFYESTLPGSGLLVYRVNKSLEGNEQGSYDSSGNPTDEVFIFRPGMTDLIEPIVLLDTGDVDGSIDDAALSNDNTYDEMGLGTSIPIWASDGTILDIGIYNVTIENGYITFEVYLQPQIELVSDDYNLRGEQVVLLDSIYTNYEVQIDSIPDNLTAYYTTDGTTPSNTSDLYVNGSTISIDGSHDEVKVALYEGTTFVSEFDKTFDFRTVLESEHDPYGNHQDVLYYVDFGDLEDFVLEFDDRTYTEVDYDYITIGANGVVNSYSGTELSGYTEYFTADEFTIRFESDEYLDDYFGFLVDVLVGDNVQLSMLGQTRYTVDVFDDFIDPGYELTGSNLENYTVDVIGTVNTDVLGEYTLTYQLRDSENNLMVEFSRTVEVVDEVAPVVELNDDSEITLEVNSDFTDPSITFSDNYDANPNVVIEGTVNTSQLGTTTITYTVTDSSGNATSVLRTVNIVDTTAPELELIGAAEINLEVLADYIDQSIIYSDNFDQELTFVVDGSVDTAVLGTTVITYTVTDSSGNQSVLTRTVVVADTIAPTGSLNIGLDTISIGTDWEDAEIMYLDNFDTNPEYTITGEVDTHTAGYYELVYTVVDSSGNELRLVRMVTVIDDETTSLVVNCRDMVTTISSEEELEVSTCISSEGVMDFEENENSMSVGVHELVFYIDVDGVRHEHLVYYYVYEEGTTINEVAYIERRDE